MSSNGTTSPPTSSKSGSMSPSGSHSSGEQRLSIDSQTSAHSSSTSGLPNGISGKPPQHGELVLNGSDDPIEQLQRELEQTREEKEALASQYRTLLAKLTDMRTRLGNKLQQDAEELDRREQLVQQLTTQNEDLAATVETLKDELIASHKDAERWSKELDTIRTRSLQENAQESLARERELRETQMELERCRMERDEWERTAEHEKAVSDDAKSTVESLRRDLDLEREARERETVELEAEREKSENLQSVLQDFQAAKDHELRQAVKDYESQLLQVTQSLAEYKHRANTAELQLDESNSNTGRTHELEKELKEKNLLIGKLRHEAVIINEHLMEALRRLRRNSTETNVDRRLVTNVLISFLNTPRNDSKKFEMLTLLASILSWTDQEREKAGLQRTGTGASTSPSTGFWGRSMSGTQSPAKGADLDKTDVTESFSALWVEFLLTEAAAGDNPSNPAPPPSSSRSNTSLPGSPTIGTFLSSPAKATRRLASFTSANMASSPNLSLPPPPSRKGKEKEADGNSS